MKRAILFLIALFLLSIAFYCQKQSADKEKMAGEDTTTSAEKTQALNEDFLPSTDDFVPDEEEPKPIKTVEPIYPDSVKKAGIEGEVWVQALIDRQGKVRDVKCIKGPGSVNQEIFCEPATKAALQYEYEPALIAGKPVAVWVQYKVKFSLK
ncbi:MAG: energy transducer TonB [candidate division Zixibacteria bacterium]|nr:energy transducer TonB [candidate division Zixibacteria bacterium]